MFGLVSVCLLLQYQWHSTRLQCHAMDLEQSCNRPSIWAHLYFITKNVDSPVKQHIDEAHWDNINRRMRRKDENLLIDPIGVRFSLRVRGGCQRITSLRSRRKGGRRDNMDIYFIWNYIHMVSNNMCRLVCTLINIWIKLQLSFHYD